MKKKLLDIDISERKFIFVLPHEEYYFLSTEPKGKNLLSHSQLSCVPLSDDFSFSGTKLLSETTSRFTEGQIYVLSPYNTFTYIEISEAKSLAAVEKMNLIIRLSQILGARSVKTKRIEIIDEESQRNITLDTEIAKIEGDLTAKSSDLRKISQAIQMNAEFTGGVPKKKITIEFLKENQLDTDRSMKHLIDMRFGTNPIEKITQDVSLTKSLQSSFQYIASLGLPEVLKQLNIPTIHTATRIEEIVNEKIEINSLVEIVFSSKGTV